MSYADREPILSAAVSSEACDALIIGDERAGKLDGGSDEKPICRITMLEMMKLIAAGSRVMAERHRLDTRAFEEAREPSLNGYVEFNPSRIDEQRNLPGCDGAQENCPAVPPAIVY